MGRVAEAITYRPYLNRDRLVYLTHPDPATGKLLGDEFVAQGFQVAMLPDLAALVAQMAIRRPDLVLMAMCDCNGAIADTLLALDAIRAQHLGIVAILLAPASLRAELVVQAMKHGANAVFSAPYAPMDIVVAAQDVFRGDIHMTASKAGGDAVTVMGFGTLTSRERQILQYVVDGRTNKEIAVDLGLSFRTVEVHRRHVMEKIGARNTAELVRLAIES